MLLRQVTLEEGEQRARELAVMFIETSAKSSYNVKQVGLYCVHRRKLVKISGGGARGARIIGGGKGQWLGAPWRVRSTSL